MNILFVVAEMAPLVKVGGVGDVGGSLPRALRRLGHDVRVALPFYKTIDRGIAQEALASANGATLWRAEHDGMPLYLLEDERFFGRDNVYAYDDDVERFLAFCDGLLANAGALGWTPDVIHMHDWHTGLLAARLAEGPHAWSNAATVFTIHNLGYRGEFTEAFAREHALAISTRALPENMQAVEAYSSLAQGILHSAIVSTVSPTYAREIVEPLDVPPWRALLDSLRIRRVKTQSLAPLLKRLGGRLAGILNGIDTDEYDPSRDAHLAVQYDADSLDKRVANKTVLQQTLGLPADGAPLIGMVTRLFDQKAPDLAVAAIEKLLPEAKFQFVVLGSGAPEYEQQLADLAARYPDRVAVRLAFDYTLGQKIYGGSDIFIMPSRYEPCGLGQMIAMRYGAVPVVRRTGGLADSVSQYDPANGSGTGFLFDALTPDALAGALSGALSAFAVGDAWRGLQLRGMRSDFSWDNAARAYVDLYQRAADGATSAK